MPAGEFPSFFGADARRIRGAGGGTICARISAICAAISANWRRLCSSASLFSRSSRASRLPDCPALTSPGVPKSPPRPADIGHDRSRNRSPRTRTTRKRVLAGYFRGAVGRGQCARKCGPPRRPLISPSINAPYPSADPTCSPSAAKEIAVARGRVHRALRNASGGASRTAIATATAATTTPRPLSILHAILSYNRVARATLFPRHAS